MLTGQWNELPPDWGFNPTVLFDAEIGLQPILLADFTDAAVAGTERIEEGPDKLLYKVTGQIAGDRLYQMSSGLIGPEAVTVTMWVAPETFELHRIVTTEPATADSEETVWQVDFTQFDNGYMPCMVNIETFKAFFSPPG